MKTFQPHTPRTGALLMSLLVNAVLLGGVLTQFAHAPEHCDSPACAAQTGERAQTGSH